MTTTKEQYIITHLLDWYQEKRRLLPWRYDHGQRGNAYHTWLSEIMLQQTTVATVHSYFLKFIHKWPTLNDLANASEHEVLTAWQGLGYYSRARNLLRCAQIVAHTHQGNFPQDLEGLRTLPGVGPYTAAAIASIAFQKPHIPMDGNIIRVFSRLYDLQTPLPALKTDIQELLDTFPPSPQPGNFAQGLMDLGATICKPKNPLCTECPLQKTCQGYDKGRHTILPLKALKAIKPTRYGKVLIIRDGDSKILLQKRPPSGLLAHMMELPTTPWLEDLDAVEKHFETMTGERDLRCLDTVITHTFTHFHLKLELYQGGQSDYQSPSSTAVFVHPQDLSRYPIPTVFKKVLRVG